MSFIYIDSIKLNLLHFIYYINLNYMKLNQYTIGLISLQRIIREIKKQKQLTKKTIQIIPNNNIKKKYPSKH